MTVQDLEMDNDSGVPSSRIIGGSGNLVKKLPFDSNSSINLAVSTQYLSKRRNSKYKENE